MLNKIPLKPTEEELNKMMNLFMIHLAAKDIKSMRVKKLHLSNPQHRLFLRAMDIFNLGAQKIVIHLPVWVYFTRWRKSQLTDFDTINIAFWRDSFDVDEFFNEMTEMLDIPEYFWALLLKEYYENE